MGKKFRWLEIPKARKFVEKCSTKSNVFNLNVGSIMMALVLLFLMQKYLPFRVRYLELLKFECRIVISVPKKPLFIHTNFQLNRLQSVCYFEFLKSEPTNFQHSRISRERYF